MSFQSIITTGAAAVIATVAVMASYATAADVRIEAFEDNDCLGAAIDNLTTTFNTCTAVNGMGMVQVNTPSTNAKNAGQCAFMTGFGDSNCTVQQGNMFAINSQCGACQGATYGVQCVNTANPSAGINVATYCVDSLCQSCNGHTAVRPNTCTLVDDLGYVVLNSVGPCTPVSYTLYYSASWCDEDEQQILPFEIPSGTCNSALRVTLLN